MERRAPLLLARWPLLLAVAMAAACGRESQPPQELAFRVVTLPAPAGGAPYSSSEPIIAIHRDGTALAVAATANTGPPPTLWRSHDAGSSWTTGASFDGTGSSTGDADVAYADGHLYALNLAFGSGAGQPTNPTIFVFHSTDGTTWSGPATFPPPHGSDQPDRPWLAVDPRDAAHVYLFHSEGGGNIVLWRSADHAATFSGPTTVTSGANSQAALALSSRPLFDPHDAARLYLFYETVAQSGSTDANAAEFPMTQVWLALSTDAGDTWSNQLVHDASAQGVLSHLLVASAIDAQGRLFAAFSLRAAGQVETHIFLMHSTDRGVTWSTPVQVDARQPSNMMPAIAAGPHALFVSWYASASPDFTDAAAEWAEEFAQTADPLAARPAFVEARISGRDPVHVGGINTAGNPGFQAGQNWGLRDLQAIAVDRCGLPHPIWAVDHGTPATQTAVPLAQGC